MPNGALTAPQIDTRRLWPRRDVRCGLRSSVPHVPCSGPERHGACPGSHAACASKIGCPDPTANALSSEKSTPLAEMFRVRAGMSPFPVDNTTGQREGKSHRATNLLPATGGGLRTEWQPRFCFLNRHRQSSVHMSLVATVASFVHLAQGTKVSRLVTGRHPSSIVQVLECTDVVRFSPDGGLGTGLRV